MRNTTAAQYSVHGGGPSGEHSAAWAGCRLSAVWPPPEVIHTPVLPRSVREAVLVAKARAVQFHDCPLPERPDVLRQAVLAAKAPASNPATARCESDLAAWLVYTVSQHAHPSSSAGPLREMLHPAAATAATA